MTGRALFASPLGFLIGMSLGALGGGGSVLAVPVLVFVVGQDPAAAITTSLLVVGVTSAVAAVAQWRGGRVRLGPGLSIGIIGVAGSLVGSALNRRLNPDVLLLAFAALVLVAAWRIAVGCPGCTRDGERTAIPDAEASLGGGRLVTLARAARARAMAKIAAAGTAIGFLTGLFGVGGGFVIVPALALGLGYPMPVAAGTSLVVIAVNTAVAFAARLGVTIDWGPTLVFVAAATAGVGAGTRISNRVEPKALQRSFAAVLIAVALYTAGRAAAGIW